MVQFSPWFCARYGVFLGDEGCTSLTLKVYLHGLRGSNVLQYQRVHLKTMTINDLLINTGFAAVWRFIGQSFKCENILLTGNPQDTTFLRFQITLSAHLICVSVKSL